MTDHPTLDDWQNRCERAEAECAEKDAEIARLRETLEPFAAFCRVVEARSTMTFGRRLPDDEIALTSAGEVGLGVVMMGHFRDALALIPAPKGWGGVYRSKIRAALGEQP